MRYAVLFLENVAKINTIIDSKSEDWKCKLKTE
jgi:hypothetical protein